MFKSSTDRQHPKDHKMNRTHLLELEFFHIYQCFRLNLFLDFPIISYLKQMLKETKQLLCQLRTIL